MDTAEAPPAEHHSAYADPWLRLGARLIDAGVLGAIQLPLLLAVLDAGDYSAAALAGGIGACLLLSVAYYTLLRSGGRQTPGAWLADLRVVTPDGEPLGWGRALRRALADAVLHGPLAVLGVPAGVLLMLTGETRQAPHDRFAGTRVVRAPAARSAGIQVAAALVLVVALPIWFRAFSAFCGERYFIPSASTRPALQQGDKIWVSKLYYRFHRPKVGDLVVFRAPPAASEEQNLFTKRVVGVGGDTLEIRREKLTWHGQVTPAGVLYRNGRRVDEPFLQEPMDPVRTPFAPKRIDPGMLYVLGDNRNNSNDSRFWGPLDERRVVGKAMFIFYPPGRAGAIR